MSATNSNPPAGAITLNRCRACSEGDGFHYSHNGWTTKVIAGVPKTRDYKAVSYVWGDTKPLPLHCLHCKKITQIPMESEEKFRRIMTLTDRPGQSLWLDALSIDQADHADIAAQIAVMGEIYSNACSVAVLLPKSDGDAYKMIEEMADLASLINTRQRVFDNNHDDAETKWLGQRCRRFFALADEFERNIHKWIYWKRAWTFQEWALAYELGLTWEGSTNLVNLANIKTPILKAATTMVVYKLQCGQYALVDTGLSRGGAPTVYANIRRLLPDEHAFIPPDAVDETEARFEALTPSIGIQNALGLREAARGHDLPCYAAFNLDAALPTSKEQRFLERFSMAMHARGVTKREAKFEADLVASWASMCNISYDYNKNDSMPLALKKVLSAMQKDHGMTTYKFQVNTRGSSGELDLAFSEYATAHRRGGSGEYIHGLPVLTGRADTATHLRIGLSQPFEMLELKGSGVNLRKVRYTSIMQAAKLTDIKLVIQAISSTSKGLMSPYFTLGENPHQDLEDVLSNPPPEAAHKMLTTAGIVVESELEDGCGQFKTWAICPAHTDLDKCFVAREAPSGTLVIAASEEDIYRVVAYLTVTDNRSASSLIKMDEQGKIDMSSPGILRAMPDGATYQGYIEKETVVAF